MKAENIHAFLALSLVLATLALYLLNIYLQAQVVLLKVFLSNGFSINPYLLTQSNFTLITGFSIVLASLPGLCKLSHREIAKALYANFAVSQLVMNIVILHIIYILSTNNYEFEVEVRISRPLHPEDILWKRIQSEYNCCGVYGFDDWHHWNASEVQKVCPGGEHMQGCVEALQAHFGSIFIANFAILTVALITTGTNMMFSLFRANKFIS